MYYVGCDLHKEHTWFYVVDKSGKKVLSKNISNKPETLEEFFKTLPVPFELAVESTYNWYFFVDIAEQYAQQVYLANSYELKAFAKRHKKTDKIDVRLIANVLSKGYLPTVTIPDKNTRNTKELLRYRMNIVKDRSRNIVRLKTLLDKLGEESMGDFNTYKRLESIPLAHFDENYNKIISGYIQRICFLKKMLFESDKIIIKTALKDTDILNLRTIPGLEYFSASLIKSEIIDINRFASFSRLCAYADLAPRVSQSANKTSYGPLNINRRKNLQWILLEVVCHFIKAIPEKNNLYKILSKTKGSNTAKVIMARFLLKIVYHVLKEKRSFIRKTNEMFQHAA
ncbi:MAG: IS110 family transposase [bacterium]